MMTARWTCGVLLLALLAVQVGCLGRPKRIYPPSIDAEDAAAEAMAAYDANKDGKIAGEELDKCASLKAGLAEIDKNSDGAITEEEIAGRIRVWQETKIGRTSFTCSVRRNGTPLADAEVKLVPEKFLGGDVIPATGKTDKRGSAMLSVPTTGRQDYPGVQLGFYRVEITKGSEVPAKYNAETTLGVEVGPDPTLRRNNTKFDLKY